MYHFYEKKLHFLRDANKRRDLRAQLRTLQAKKIMSDLCTFRREPYGDDMCIRRDLAFDSYA